MSRAWRLFGMLFLGCGGLIADPRASDAQIVPGRLEVSPLGGYSSSGPAGGPFTPPSRVYRLTNSGGESLSWTASHTRTWVTLSSLGGTIGPGGFQDVTLSINSEADALTPGVYTDPVTFSSLAGTALRTVTLTVGSGPPPTIVIDPAPPDTTDTTPLVVTGTATPASSEFAITQVIWNTVNKDWFWGGYAGGTSSWRAEVPLVPGENDISITVRDSGGGQGTVQFTVVYTGTTTGPGKSCGATGAEAFLLISILGLLRRCARRSRA